ncbi:MAG: DUF1990 family protein [Gemmataceae bacterium]|nr:DUF1990 family protein [Gemmataceae bacterium]
MQFILTCLGQKPRLEDWVNRPFTPTADLGPRSNDRRDSFEKIVAVEVAGAPEANGAHRRVARAIFAYEVFPPKVVSPVLRKVPLEPGDTVGILFHFLPGLDMFCAARVVECFDEEQGGQWRTGFKYRTLAGHPELGEEIFSVEKNMATGEVVAALRSWSRPGNWLTWLAGPYTRHLQVRSNQSALVHMASVAAGAVK